MDWSMFERRQRCSDCRLGESVRSSRLVASAASASTHACICYAAATLSTSRSASVALGALDAPTLDTHSSNVEGAKKGS